MLVSFDWIKDFLDISAPPDEVAERLTMAGLEVEGKETIDDDTVFEVNVTPNRPDCLSILGIAREVAAAFKLPLKISGHSIGGVLPQPEIHVEILDAELCNRYTGRLIKGVTISYSPEWLKRRLEKCGIRSLDNNIVDITNYVLLELGHPLHAFDADKLAGSKICVAKAGENSSITTLDGIERKLSGNALLIQDEKRPVAVAGIMGSEESGVTLKTRNIFLESAYFSPISIRRTSKELGLTSESSYRFERGTDIEFLVNALNRASLLIRETGGGVIHDIVDVYPKRYTPKMIAVGYRKVNSLLGTDLQKGEILEMLERIGIKTEDRGEVFHVYPPSFRRDISEYVDVVEEVARLLEYGNIPVRIPKAILADGLINKKEMQIKKTREALRKSGFTEVINYSFMNQTDLDFLLIPGNDVRRRSIRIRNPLRQEDSLMRTTLIPSLITNFIYNISRDINEIRFFEIAKVYIDRGEQLPAEEFRLGGIFYREKAPSIWAEDVLPFYTVKGALQSFFEEMKISEYSFIHSREPFLHTGKSADIVIKKSKIGFLGEISPDVVEGMNLKIHKPEIMVFELNIDMMLSFLPERVTYSQIPKFPFIERDIAIVIDRAIASAEVMDALKSYKSECIEKVELFDHYTGRNIPEGKKSLGFRIIYRSKDKTLRDEEVESVHGELVEFIIQKTGGEIRGQ